MSSQYPSPAQLRLQPAGELESQDNSVIHLVCSTTWTSLYMNGTAPKSLELICPLEIKVRVSLGHFT